MLEFFYFLHFFTRSRDIIFSLLAVFFLPGTIVHEMSHFIAAIVLFLPVGEIRIMPEWKENHVQLGRVTYGKKDVIRGVLVGIAPLFGALFFFWFLNAFRIFPSSNLIMNVIFGYLVFTVSANMFSSKQDLVDLIYVIPIGLIVAAIVYITGIKIDFPVKAIEYVANLLNSVNFYITMSLGIHVVSIIFFKSLRYIARR